MTDDLKYSSKTFIGTDPTEVGAICASIYRQSYDNYDSFDASVRLQDCSKHIILDFCIDSPEQRLERITKVEKLIHELLAFKESFVVESEKHLEAKKKREESEGK